MRIIWVLVAMRCDMVWRYGADELKRRKVWLLNCYLVCKSSGNFNLISSECETISLLIIFVIVTMQFDWCGHRHSTFLFFDSIAAPIDESSSISVWLLGSTSLYFIRQSDNGEDERFRCKSQKLVINKIVSNFYVCNLCREEALLIIRNIAIILHDL